MTNNTIHAAEQSREGSVVASDSLPSFQRRYLSSLPPSQHQDELQRRQERSALWYNYYLKHGATIRPKYKAFSDEEIGWLMDAANRYRKDWAAILEEHKRVFPQIQPPRTKSSISTKWRRQRVQMGHGVRLSDQDRPVLAGKAPEERSPSPEDPHRAASPQPRRSKRIKR